MQDSMGKVKEKEEAVGLLREYCQEWGGQKAVGGLVSAEAPRGRGSSASRTSADHSPPFSHHKKKKRKCFSLAKEANAEGLMVNGEAILTVTAERTELRASAFASENHLPKNTRLQEGLALVRQWPLGGATQDMIKIHEKTSGTAGENGAGESEGKCWSQWSMEHSLLPVFAES